MVCLPLKEENEMQAKHVKSQEIFNQIGSRHIRSIYMEVIRKYIRLETGCIVRCDTMKIRHNWQTNQRAEQKASEKSKHNE